MKTRRRIAHLLGALTILAISCDVSILLPAATVPTPVPGVVDTIVAATAGVAFSQTAILLPPSLTPSATPTVTRTPSATPTFTPTFVFVFKFPTSTKERTATPVGGGSSAGAGLGCKLISQTPADGTHFAAKKSFSAQWKVKNTGGSSWEAGSVEFAYFSGDKFYKGAVHNLPASVGPGENVDLSAGMVAPSNPGTYQTVWSLRQGASDFCHVDLTIVVP